MTRTNIFRRIHFEPRLITALKSRLCKDGFDKQTVLSLCWLFKAKHFDNNLQIGNHKNKTMSNLLGFSELAEKLENIKYVAYCIHFHVKPTKEIFTQP